MADEFTGRRIGQANALSGTDFRLKRRIFPEKAHRALHW
jgi:hypothetical protein